MKTIKKTAEYTVIQRRDGRYAVRGAHKQWINGDAKVDILVKEGLLTQPARKPEPEPEAEAPDEAAAGSDSDDQAGGES